MEETRTSQKARIRRQYRKIHTRGLNILTLIREDCFVLFRANDSCAKFGIGVRSVDRTWAASSIVDTLTPYRNLMVKVR